MKIHQDGGNARWLIPETNDDSDVELERTVETPVLETDFFGIINHNADSALESGEVLPVSTQSSLLDNVHSYGAVCNDTERSYACTSSSMQSALQTAQCDRSVIPCNTTDFQETLHPYEYGPYFSHQPMCQEPSSEFTDDQARKLISKFEAEPFGHSLPDTLHIVDVRVDDYMNDIRENVLRNVSLTKPQTSNSGVPTEEKDKPTIVAKRKHQITYLAHLAKEREGQLEQQWAQNRQRRREARLKYGF